MRFSSAAKARVYTPRAEEIATNASIVFVLMMSIRVMFVRMSHRIMMVRMAVRCARRYRIRMLMLVMNVMSMLVLMIERRVNMHMKVLLR